jgi:hypothetical protein
MCSRGRSDLLSKMRTNGVRALKFGGALQKLWSGNEVSVVVGGW